MAQKTWSSNWADYELIDAGGGKKLERWGNVITIRPEIQAYFKTEMPFSQWKNMANAAFIPQNTTKGKWHIYKEVPKDWKVKYKNLTFLLDLTTFKHVGLFPEQQYNWEILQKVLNPDKKMLNLFAYTGAASVVGKNSGANVTHVDSVKQLITWARKNMEVSALENIRWICDDALKFAQKEVKRKKQYDVIIMDPPAYGIGAKKERWKIEDKLPVLLKTASDLLSPDGMLILNTYSPKVTLRDIHAYTKPLFPRYELTELWKKSSTGKELFYGFLLHAWK